MLSEKGLCKILKQAYKQGGYEIMPVAMADDGAGRWRRSEITSTERHGRYDARRWICRKRRRYRSWRMRDICQWSR